MNVALRYCIKLFESYLFIAVFAIILGLIFPSFFSNFSSFTTFFLQIIFFFSSLKLESSELFRAGKQWKTLFAVNAVILIILPVLTYWMTTLLIPDLTLALVLLAAMPAGMSLPLMVDVIGGNRSLALLLTISSSLLAPITVPLVLSQLTSASVQLPLTNMAWKLFVVIILPFILAQCIRRFLPQKNPKFFHTFKPISLILLGLLIAASIAVNAESIIGATENITTILFILFVFFTAIHLLTHLLFIKKPYRERITIAASVTFMNFTLGIYLAGLYIHDPLVILTLILSIIPWAVLLIPFKSITDLLRKYGRIS